MTSCHNHNELSLAKANFCTQEIAEPMLDLKTGIEELRKCKALKHILATVLTIGNFLNGTEVDSLDFDFNF